jgi:hypothetical protein
MNEAQSGRGGLFRNFASLYKRNIVALKSAQHSSTYVMIIDENQPVGNTI